MRFLTPTVWALGLTWFSAHASESATPLLRDSAFAGWAFVAAPATPIARVCTLSADGVLSAAGQPVGFLSSTASHANYRLHAEWRWSGKPGNGGILVHIDSGPKDRAWPECFQIQTKHGAVGDLLPMAGASFAEPLTSAPGASPQLRAHSAANSEKPVGEWNSCDIVCRGDTIEVTINGVLQNRVTGTSLRAGRIGFQFEGTSFELRNVSLASLD